jgi:hypothetical protein
MRQTNEQRSAMERLRAVAGPYRVTPDIEGWPMIEGRLGRIEWSDPMPGMVTLAVFTDRRRMHAKILAIPAIQRHQTGDDELRAVFPTSALPVVASVIRARRKRTVSAASLRNLNPAAGAHDRR